MLLSQIRFSALLITLLLFAVLNPLLEEIGLIRAQILLNISFTMILLSGTYAVTNTRRAFFSVMLLALSPVILMWFNLFFGWNVKLTIEILLATYFLVIAILILRRVLKDEKVTGEKISAALCVYFMLGILWAFFYSIASNLRPGSIVAAGSGFSQFVYYSMITLTTVGYGDITPVAPLTRSLAFVEAITGQFYLTVLVARLVGLHIVHAAKEK